jgi:hypothetical protein
MKLSAFSKRAYIQCAVHYSDIYCSFIWPILSAFFSLESGSIHHYSVPPTLNSRQYGWQCKSQPQSTSAVFAIHDNIPQYSARNILRFNGKRKPYEGFCRFRLLKIQHYYSPCRNLHHTTKIRVSAAETMLVSFLSETTAYWLQLQANAERALLFLDIQSLAKQTAVTFTILSLSYSSSLI